MPRVLIHDGKGSTRRAECQRNRFVVYSINEVSLRQTITPDRLLGRVNSSMEITSHSVLLLGILAGGALGETLGLRATLALGAAAMLVAALWLAASPVRGLTGAASAEEVGPVTPLVPEAP